MFDSVSFVKALIGRSDGSEPVPNTDTDTDRETVSGTGTGTGTDTEAAAPAPPAPNTSSDDPPTLSPRVTPQDTPGAASAPRPGAEPPALRGFDEVPPGQRDEIATILNNGTPSSHLSRGYRVLSAYYHHYGNDAGIEAALHHVGISGLTESQLHSWWTNLRETGLLHDALHHLEGSGAHPPAHGWDSLHEPTRHTSLVPEHLVAKFSSRPGQSTSFSVPGPDGSPLRATIRQRPTADGLPDHPRMEWHRPPADPDSSEVPPTEVVLRFRRRTPPGGLDVRDAEAALVRELESVVNSGRPVPELPEPALGGGRPPSERAVPHTLRDGSPLRLRVEIVGPDHDPSQVHGDLTWAPPSEDFTLRQEHTKAAPKVLSWFGLTESAGSQDRRGAPAPTDDQGAPLPRRPKVTSVSLNNLDQVLVRHTTTPAVSEDLPRPQTWTGWEDLRKTVPVTQIGSPAHASGVSVGSREPLRADNLRASPPTLPSQGMEPRFEVRRVPIPETEQVEDGPTHVQEITWRVLFDRNGVPEEKIRQHLAAYRDQLERALNGRHRLPDEFGDPGDQLHVRVEVVGDPGVTGPVHADVTWLPLNADGSLPRSSAHRWAVDDNPKGSVHETLHWLTLMDEYPETGPGSGVLRRHPGSSRVDASPDGNIMANARAFFGGLRQHHLDHIGAVIRDAGPRSDGRAAPPRFADLPFPSQLNIVNILQPGLGNAPVQQAREFFSKTLQALGAYYDHRVRGLPINVVAENHISMMPRPAQRISFTEAHTRQARAVLEQVWQVWEGRGGMPAVMAELQRNGLDTAPVPRPDRLSPDLRSEVVDTLLPEEALFDDDPVDPRVADSTHAVFTAYYQHQVHHRDVDALVRDHFDRLPGDDHREKRQEMLDQWEQWRGDGSLADAVDLLERNGVPAPSGGWDAALARPVRTPPPAGAPDPGLTWTRTGAGWTSTPAASPAPTGPPAPLTVPERSPDSAPTASDEDAVLLDPRVNPTETFELTDFSLWGDRPSPFAPDTAEDTGDPLTTPAPEPAPDTGDSPPAPEDRQLDYMITSGWIESYGVKIDSDRVLNTFSRRAPRSVRDTFRRLIAQDPRPFFRPRGVTVKGPEDRDFTLRLSSQDDRWRPGSIVPDSSSAPTTSQYKALHDLQEQSGRSASGSQGNPKRVGAGFQGHFLASGAVTPLPSFRISGSKGASSWQQSAETGQTVSRTTEMTGGGTDYRTGLSVTLETDTNPDGEPLTWQVPFAAQITVMGGLKPRSADLPQTIGFTDPFTAPRTTPAAAPPGPAPAPRHYGRYLGNSHPISVESITLTPTGSGRGGTDRAGSERTDRQNGDDLGQWVADRLGYDKIAAAKPPEGSGRLKRMNWRLRKAGAHERGEEIRESLSAEKMADYLPVLTNDPVSIEVTNAKGRPSVVTMWSYPVSMRQVPDAPDTFNIKHTDKFSRGSTTSAGHVDSLTVRPGFGVLERLAGDAVRMELPMFEYRYTRENVNSRARESSAWDAHLFHGTDTAVYQVERRIAVWTPGDENPTLFDARTTEALTAQEVRALSDPATNQPAPDPSFSLHDSFLGRDRVTHFGTSLVRNVTYPDGGEFRQVRGKPTTVFRDYAYQLLDRIDAKHPGLVLPHLAIPGAEPPRKVRAGWNHRRNYDTAVRNTIKVLEAASLNNFRFRRDDWVSPHGLEVKLEETKKFPGADEARNKSLLPPDHISVWLTAAVDRPAPGPRLEKSHTGSTAGSSAGQRKRNTKNRGHSVEGRAGVTWRNIVNRDARDYPSNTGGGGFKLGWEKRSNRNRDFGHSVTGETNVKDKGTTQQLFSNVVLGARIGTDNDLVPWPSRISPKGSDTSTDLFPDDGHGVRGRVELHSLENRRPITVDPPQETGPLTTPGHRRPERTTATNPEQSTTAAPERTTATTPPPRVAELTGAAAKDLFQNGFRSRIVNPDGNRVFPPGDARDRPADDEIQIIQTPGARRLQSSFGPPQAFDPTIRRDGQEPVTALSYTYDHLDQDHFSFTNSLTGKQAVGQLVSNHMSPQTLAGSPELLGNSGSRLRFQSGDWLVSPFRTRTTLSTFYVPTRVVSLTPRPKAVVESSQTKEAKLGAGSTKNSNLYFAGYGRGGFNTNPDAPSSSTQGSGSTPDGALNPILRPKGEVRFDFLGRGTVDSNSVTFRVKTEIKLQGPSIEYVTDGVIGQSIERRHDFSFLLTVPRAPSTSGYSAWLASVPNAQKGMVPALWAYKDGLVVDRITWGPDGTVTRVDAHPAPPPPNSAIGVLDGLSDKGYQSKPLDPNQAMDRLVADLRRGGLELTDSSREDLHQQLTSQLNRNLGGLPPLPVEVRSGPRGIGRPAYVTMDLTQTHTTTPQMGGKAEFIEKVSFVNSVSEGDYTFSGWSGDVSMEVRVPPRYEGSDQGGTPPDRRPVGFGPEPGYQVQKAGADVRTTGLSPERSHERALFSPFAIMESDTTLTLTLHLGDRSFTGASDPSRTQNVYPTPYLTIGASPGTPSPAPVHFRDVSGRTPPDRSEAVQDWVDEKRPQGYAPVPEKSTRFTPVGVRDQGRAVFDAAYTAAARANGWRPGDGQDQDAQPDEAASAKEFLDKNFSKEISTSRNALVDKGKRLLDDVLDRAAPLNPVDFVGGETALRGIAADALGDPEGTQLVRFADTRVHIKAVPNLDGMTIVSSSEESRSRDADQSGFSSSHGRAEMSGHGPFIDERGSASARGQDRMYENSGGSAGVNSTSSESRSTGAKGPAVAEGPGTRRLFLVSVPTRWLVSAEAPGTVPGFGTLHNLSLVEADAPVLLWITEGEARDRGLDVDDPALRTLADAEAAFGKADLDYLEARLPLAELVAQREERAGDPAYREEYATAERRVRDTGEERTRRLRELEAALAGARGVPLPPAPDPSLTTFTPPQPLLTTTSSSTSDGGPPPAPPQPSRPAPPVPHGTGIQFIRNGMLDTIHESESESDSDLYSPPPRLTPPTRVLDTTGGPSHERDYDAELDDYELSSRHRFRARLFDITRGDNHRADTDFRSPPPPRALPFRVLDAANEPDYERDYDAELDDYELPSRHRPPTLLLDTTRGSESWADFERDYQAGLDDYEPVSRYRPLTNPIGTAHGTDAVLYAPVPRRFPLLSSASEEPSTSVPPAPVAPETVPLPPSPTVPETPAQQNPPPPAPAKTPPPPQPTPVTTEKTPPPAPIKTPPPPQPTPVTTEKTPPPAPAPITTEKTPTPTPTTTTPTTETQPTPETVPLPPSPTVPETPAPAPPRRRSSDPGPSPRPRTRRFPFSDPAPTEEQPRPDPSSDSNRPGSSASDTPATTSPEPPAPSRQDLLNLEFFQQLNLPRQ
ncbi:hypothetical protein [Actinorugispora endophytica]|uniref:hypothetical protein n=1 Tax=Actinorugispora endophytica TaxID=1605990 RepID=UPI00105F29F7|nr:hypothetical protein [Actinorugispora endophytica]